MRRFQFIQKIFDCRSDNEKSKADYMSLRNHMMALETKNTNLGNHAVALQNRVVVLENEKNNMKRRIEELEDDVEVLEKDKKKRRRHRRQSSTSKSS